MVKNLTVATFGCCAFCLVTSWFISYFYISSTDVDAHETVYILDLKS